MEKQNFVLRNISKLLIIISIGFFLTYLWLFLANQSAINTKAETNGKSNQVTASPQAFCDNVTEITRTECVALVSLYNSTNGDSWFTNTGWIDTYTPCSWYGIDCEFGHVRSIGLYGNNLSGTLPNADRSQPVTMDYPLENGIRLLKADVVSERNRYHHDSKKLAHALIRLYYDRNQPPSDLEVERKLVGALER